MHAGLPGAKVPPSESNTGRWATPWPLSRRRPSMETTIGGSALAVLKDGLKGHAFVPGDVGYGEARAAWNLNAHQRPAVVVVAEGAADVLAAVRLARDEGLGVGGMGTGHGGAAPGAPPPRQRPAVVVVAEGAADVLAAVRLARDEGLGVGVMATGHGVAAPCDGGGLINTSRMRGVHVDPETRTARAEAGAKWADLVPEATAHGLAGPRGSTSHVGIVGYTMGGGFGWLGRRYGFAADSVKEADVVTAEGELGKVSAHENADLLDR